MAEVGRFWATALTLEIVALRVGMDPGSAEQHCMLVLPDTLGPGETARDDNPLRAGQAA